MSPKVSSQIPCFVRAHARTRTQTGAYLTTGRREKLLPLDNNATERAIRGPVVGRRNHFGSKSKRGTEVAAIFYTLLETAKLCGVDPARYLREAALADARGEVLLPHALAEAASA